MFPQVAQEGLPTSIEFPQQFHLLYPSLRASAGRSAITASNSQRQLVATKRGPSLHLYSIIASKLSRNITSTHAAIFRCYLHRVQLVSCELML